MSIIRKLKIAPTTLFMTQLQLCLQVETILLLVVSTGSSTISLIHLHILVVHLYLHHLLHLRQWNSIQWLRKPHSHPLSLQQWWFLAPWKELEFCSLFAYQNELRFQFFVWYWQRGPEEHFDSVIVPCLLHSIHAWERTSIAFHVASHETWSSLSHLTIFCSFLLSCSVCGLSYVNVDVLLVSSRNASKSPLCQARSLTLSSLENLMKIFSNLKSRSYSGITSGCICARSSLPSLVAAVIDLLTQVELY